MKTLYIVRHATAENARAGLPDFNRLLTKHGQEQASYAAQILSKNSTKVDLVLTSSALRTLATAKIIAEEIHYPIDRLQSIPEMYLASLADILEVISLLDEKYNSVMLVGHNPTITLLAQYLSSQVMIDLSPGTIIVLAFHQQSWHSVIKNSCTLLSTIQPK